MTAPSKAIAKPKPIRGRPLSLTKDLQARILQLVVSGFPPLEAARSLQIPDRTFHGWMARGRGEGGTAGPQTPALKSFFLEVQAAEAKTFGVAWSRVLANDPVRFLKMRNQDQSRHADRALARELAEIRELRLAPAALPDGSSEVTVGEPFVQGIATPERALAVAQILLEAGAFDHLIEVVDVPEGEDEAEGER